MRFPLALTASPPAEQFRLVDANLQESFRVLVPGRSQGELLDLDGIRIISLGVAFQMFNAAFVSAPVYGGDGIFGILGSRVPVRLCKAHTLLQSQIG